MTDAAQCYDHKSATCRWINIRHADLSWVMLITPQNMHFTMFHCVPYLYRKILRQNIKRASLKPSEDNQPGFCRASEIMLFISCTCSFNIPRNFEIIIQSTIAIVFFINKECTALAMVFQLKFILWIMWLRCQHTDLGKANFILKKVNEKQIKNKQKDLG